MTASAFLLFRINLVDRENIFSKPIPNDEALERVIQAASSPSFDVERTGRRSAYRWSLREATPGEIEEVGRRYVFVKFTCETLSRHGQIVTPERVIEGTSVLNPPSALVAAVVIDLGRHVIAVEEVSQMIQTRGGWKKHLETILNSAAWEFRYTSMVQLTPVVPADEVALQLERFQKLTRLRMTLRIPNPDLGPSFKRLFEDMKQGGIREMTQDMKNEQGLAVQGDTLPRAALDMALTGYRKGDIHVYGYRDGHLDAYRITQDVIRVELEGILDFIEGYAAGSQDKAVKNFAKRLISRIDESLKPGKHDDES